MTGFGVASRPWAEGPGGRPHQLVVELRGVNQRFREFKIRQPFGPAWEQKIRKAIEARIGRGRLDVTVALHRQGEEAESSSIDAVRIAEVLKTIGQVREIAAQEKVELAPFNALELLAFMESQGRSPGGHSEGPREPPADLLECLGQALDGLTSMRMTEGESLATVLHGLLDTFEAQVETLRAETEGEGERLAGKLRERVEAILYSGGNRAGGEAPDPGRIAQEVALLVQKADIAEELDRIASHLLQMRGVLDAPAKVGDGKTLDFLCQELFREITTIGSKVSSHRGSGVAVEAKASVERIREQVQNVE